MTRVYVRTHVGLMDDEAYMALSPLGKAAWHTVNMLQGKQTEERFKSRTQILTLLRRDGFADDAERALVDLESNGWIVDSPDRPGVELKGWHRWQAEKRNQYYRDYRAERRNSNVSDTDPIRTASSHVPYRTVTEGVQGEPTPEEAASIARAKADIERIVKAAETAPPRRRRSTP